MGYPLQNSWASLMAQLVKESACNAGDLGSIPGLEKGKATHSSILAWRIPWTTVHGVAKSQTRLSDFHFLPSLHLLPNYLMQIECVVITKDKE